MNASLKNNVRVTGNLNAAETIIFGHGFGIDQLSFNALISYFEKDYKLVLYDNIGGGNSDITQFSTNRYADLNGYVNDVEEIIHALELANIIYVGHSVNGMIGLMCSIRIPEKFKKIVLLGASPRYLNDEASGYYGGFNQEDLDGLYDAMTTNFEAWASGFSQMAMGHKDRPELAKAFASTLLSIRPDIAQFVARSIFESDHRDLLPQIKHPVLIAQTSNDIAVPLAVGDYLHRNITNSHLIKINAEGHFPHLSAPAEVAQGILAFI